MSKGGGGGGTLQTHVFSFFDPFFDADASVDGDVLDLDGNNKIYYLAILPCWKRIMLQVRQLITEPWRL